MIDLDRVKRAIKHVEAAGWVIKSGLWADSVTKECCPLSAVMIAETDKPPLNGEDGAIIGMDLANILDTPVDDVFRFADGFDSGKHTNEHNSAFRNNAHAQGVEMREFCQCR